MWNRHNPYSRIGNDGTKFLGEVIAEMGEKFRNNELSEQEIVEFLHAHKICFQNDRTGQLSSDWSEPEANYKKASFVCVISCSCECGPMDEGCNQLGPGSKPKYDFTFKE